VIIQSVISKNNLTLQQDRHVRKLTKRKIPRMVKTNPSDNQRVQRNRQKSLPEETGKKTQRGTCGKDKSGTCLLLRE